MGVFVFCLEVSLVFVAGYCNSVVSTHLFYLSYYTV